MGLDLGQHGRAQGVELLVLADRHGQVLAIDGDPAHALLERHLGHLVHGIQDLGFAQAFAIARTIGERLGQRGQALRLRASDRLLLDHTQPLGHGDDVLAHLAHGLGQHQVELVLPVVRLGQGVAHRLEGLHQLGVLLLEVVAHVECFLEGVVLLQTLDDLLAQGLVLLLLAAQQVEQLGLLGLGQLDLLSLAQENLLPRVGVVPGERHQLVQRLLEIVLAEIDGLLSLLDLLLHLLVLLTFSLALALGLGLVLAAFGLVLAQLGIVFRVSLHEILLELVRAL